MKKIKLILQSKVFTIFASWYLQPLLREYFDVESYDETKTYDRHGTVFIFYWMDQNPLVNQLYDQGYKIAIDNLSEVPDTRFDQFHQINIPNQFWYKESLHWQALGYNQYTPNKTYKKVALMTIRRVDNIRDTIVKKMQPWLDQMIWSYKDQRLPNDDYIADYYRESADVNQRFMNPQWYDDTCINLVVESCQGSQGLFVSEKIYKPCAYYQPMLVIGRPGALAWIKNQGFETFDNIFDESYDLEVNFEKRLHAVLENLNRVVKESYSDLTWEKLKHNHNLFFNEQMCKQKITTEIIQPLIEHAQTR
jgi:hypothetical protein